MFTGLVEEVGTVRGAARRGDSMRLEIGCAKILDDLRAGDSVSIDGACQTAVAVSPDGFTVDTLAETLRKATLGSLRRGSHVNLERALRVGDRLGGHLVQGHVDGVGTVASIDRSDRNVYLTVRLDDHLLRYCVSEGSIAINGISLTIASMTDDAVRVNVIPETWSRTNLQERSAGDAVNIEVDVLARYVERLMPNTDAASGAAKTTQNSRLTAGALLQWGYGG